VNELSLLYKFQCAFECHIISCALYELFRVIASCIFVYSFSSKQDDKVANVRRENKLYSYSEQMAELELKKVRFTVLIPITKHTRIFHAWLDFAKANCVAKANCMALD
jgi:hypothetical protein